MTGQSESFNTVGLSHQLTINKDSFVFEDVRFEVGAAMHDWPLEGS